MKCSICEIDKPNVTVLSTGTVICDACKGVPEVKTKHNNGKTGKTG